MGTQRNIPPSNPKDRRTATTFSDMTHLDMRLIWALCWLMRDQAIAEAKECREKGPGSQKLEIAHSLP